MNAIETARETRSRNLARLRKLTIGTAAISVAATSGFGWLAAMSTVAATTATTTSYVSTGSTNATTTNATTSSTGSSTRSATISGISSSSGTAHATSGGS